MEISAVYDFRLFFNCSHFFMLKIDQRFTVHCVDRREFNLVTVHCMDRGEIILLPFLVNPIWLPKVFASTLFYF
jgi:hypothetical protein